MTKERPIVFVCHSFGSIVAKKAMSMAHEHGGRYGDLFEAIRGILYMGTPHRGTEEHSWGEILANLASITGTGSTKLDILKDLQLKSNARRKLFTLP